MPLNLVLHLLFCLFSIPGPDGPYRLQAFFTPPAPFCISVLSISSLQVSLWNMNPIYTSGLTILWKDAPRNLRMHLSQQWPNLCILSNSKIGGKLGESTASSFLQTPSILTGPIFHGGTAQRFLSNPGQPKVQPVCPPVSPHCIPSPPFLSPTLQVTRSLQPLWLNQGLTLPARGQVEKLLHLSGD